MNNSISIEPWFIPFDILQIISSSFALLLAVLFLLIIIFDKTCHSVPMILVFNSCLSELLFSFVTLISSIFAFDHDQKQIYSSDTFCLLHGHLIYLADVVQNYSYLLQAIYRYVTIVYPARMFWQSGKFQIFLIILTWIGGIIYTIGLLLTNQVKYHIDDQMCQMPLGLSFITMFNVSYLYLIPMGSIILIYFKMVRYVRDMRRRVTPVNTLFYAQQELRMIGRIVLLVFILISLGFPYTIFIFMSFFNHAPKYHFRIAYIFVDISVAAVMIALFQITEPLKVAVMKRITGRRPGVVPSVT